MKSAFRYFLTLVLCSFQVMAPLQAHALPRSLEKDYRADAGRNVRKAAWHFNWAAKQYRTKGSAAFEKALALRFSESDFKFIKKELGNFGELPHVIPGKTHTYFMFNGQIIGFDTFEVAQGIFRWNGQIYRYNYSKDLASNVQAWKKQGLVTKNFVDQVMGLIIPHADAKGRTGNSNGKNEKSKSGWLWIGAAILAVVLGVKFIPKIFGWNRQAGESTSSLSSLEAGVAPHEAGTGTLPEPSSQSRYQPLAPLPGKDTKESPGKTPSRPESSIGQRRGSQNFFPKPSEPNPEAPKKQNPPPELPQNQPPPENGGSLPAPESTAPTSEFVAEIDVDQLKIWLDGSPMPLSYVQKVRDEGVAVTEARKAEYLEKLRELVKDYLWTDPPGENEEEKKKSIARRLAFFKEIEKLVVIPALVNGSDIGDSIKAITKTP